MAETVPEGTTELKLLDRMVNGPQLGCDEYEVCRANGCTDWKTGLEHCYNCGHALAEH